MLCLRFQNLISSDVIMFDPYNRLPPHARRVLDNLQAVLVAGGSSLEQVVKTTIFLADIADFAAVNEVYASYFAAGVKPARAAVQAGALPLGARVEIEAVAIVA